MLLNIFKVFIIYSLIFFYSLNADARTYIFYYPKAKLKIGIEADGYIEAFKKAAKKCFKILSEDKYQGEEKGMEIIDICANPQDGRKMTDPWGVEE